tara:strand:+ start:297 stop:803 length:507 start_codon:yes stop_codon:yes gene_type:complete
MNTYIENLHGLVSDVLAVQGVSDNEDGTYRIDYIDEPTPAQLSEINAILDSWPLEKAKLEKLETVDGEWRAVLKNGWTTQYGWSLGLDIPDVALLNGNFVLAKEADSLGISGSVFVVDISGKSHELSFPELTALMLQYGQARAALSAEDASKRTAIQEANTIEELMAL